MDTTSKKCVQYLIVDTSAFIRNAPLQNVGSSIITCQEVVDEITNKRQLRRLVVLPYDLEVKLVYPENVKFVTEFAKKTGDYPSLSATDLKVIALTYQLEKLHVGTEHIRETPIVSKAISYEKPKIDDHEFCVPGKVDEDDQSSDDSFYSANEDFVEEFNALTCFEDATDVLAQVESDDDYDDSTGTDDDSEEGWITPANIEKAKKQLDSESMEKKYVKVACMTTDFSMQNVLKQMNLNVAALDGKMIKRLRTYILRCYGCFKTTSIMTKEFCPNCGNKTLKRVSVSVNENGEQKIHINTRRPLTRRGKKFSLPTVKGGKHSNNPILTEDQPVPDRRPTRLARTKNNPLDDDYIAGFSPFVMRDVTSKSAQLKIRPPSEIKHWMKRNPNECRRRRK